MKKLIRVVTQVLMFAMAGFASVAFGSEYLGEVCWTIDDSAQMDEDYILKLGITDMGDGHFLVNGVQVAEDGTSSSTGDMVTGNAEIVGEEVIFSLNASSDDAEQISASQLFVRLSAATLNGTYNGIQTTYDKGEDDSFVGFGTGAVTLLDCP